MERPVLVPVRVVGERGPSLGALRQWVRRRIEDFLCSMGSHGEANRFVQNERGGLGGWLYQDVHYSSCSRCGAILERRAPGT